MISSSTTTTCNHSKTQNPCKVKKKKKKTCNNYCQSTLIQIEHVSVWSRNRLASFGAHLCLYTFKCVCMCVFYVTLGSSRRLQRVMLYFVVAVGNPLKAVSVIKSIRLAIAILSQRLACWTVEREQTYFSPCWSKRLSTPIWLFKLPLEKK